MAWTGIAIAFALSCQTPRGTQRHSAPPPSGVERYCAWYADTRDRVLYTGLAPFWASMRSAGGDPRADLLLPGPQQIGRFDLELREWLEPLDVGPAHADADRPGPARSGVWDVLPHPSGRVYFSTFYESAGFVDPRSARVVHFDALGLGLNELAPGPSDSIVATRYGGYGGDPFASGSLVVFSPEGGLLQEHPLEGPPGFALAPKSVAFDPDAQRYWVTTDLVRRDPAAAEPASLHPTLVVDASGGEIARIDTGELHFVRFESPGGRGFAAIAHGERLRLVELGDAAPATYFATDAGWLLESAFPGALDFVQDMSFGPAGEVVVTRWSGTVHVLDAAGRLRSVSLPTPDESGLYYGAALTNDQLCATYCSDVSVVCVPAAALR